MDANSVNDKNEQFDKFAQKITETSLTLAHYQFLAYQKINKHDTARDEICNWLVGLAEEVGEVAGKIKHSLWGHENCDFEGLAKEIGDVLWYLSALCSTLNIGIEECAKLNILKLTHRHFGANDFSYKGSMNRKEKEIVLKDHSAYKQLMNSINKGWWMYNGEGDDRNVGNSSGT